MLSIAPLPGPFGVAIDGLDLRQPLADETMREVLAAFYENQLVVIRGQELTPEEYERFGHNFGTPHPHVLSHHRLPGLPGVMALTNIVERRVSHSTLNGAAFWHTDQSYEAEPSSATMLYARQVPKSWAAEPSSPTCSPPTTRWRPG